MNAAKERVCVMLSSYNGERYIDQQIKSVMAQKDVEMTLLIRDDGSSDDTDAIIGRWADNDSRIKRSEEQYGINLGVTGSFMHLLREAVGRFPDIGYFFFCDQDDVWLSRKCIRAVEKIKAQDKEMVLYYSSKILVDGQLGKLGRKDPLSCRNDIWDFFDRSNAYGCTMCMSRKLAEYIISFDCDVPYMHDSYIYRMAIASDVGIVADRCGTIYYRLHGDNVAGAVKRNYFKGIKKVIGKKNEHFLSGMCDRLVNIDGIDCPPDKRKVLDDLCIYRHSIGAKLRLLWGYIRLSNRSLKEKLVFAGCVAFNYF